ncbi:hypothetical protein DFQ27_001692 [Actinomortierella ambigua]|uniref:Pre-rRNA processing protein n=1 Tax=Actinomortierella ambigua TaxID=1343610 RepID=A0A9P6Q9D9_9FUNG|nr:hypothetical protein DFQ27_001692 [Actinomortierella ambigua]
MAFDIRDEEGRDPDMDEFDEYEDVKQPERPKFYRRRRFWMCCIPTTIITIVVAVVLALYVIMPKIAQGLMNKSAINLHQIDITAPTESKMSVAMKGKMENTGPFHAEISFPEPVQVSWNGAVLGTTTIPGKSSASGGSGDLDVVSDFTVTDAAKFAEFSSYMLNSESFIWKLDGKLNVKALGHTVKGLDLSKEIKVSAFNGLQNIKIEKFSLPGDDPTGKGINVEITTSVTNPSSIQMDMGTLTLAISYKNTFMGLVSTDNLVMVRGPQTMTLKGVLVPQTTAEGLADTSDLMSRYIANVVTDTLATGHDVLPAGGPVSWLSSAIKNLKLTVPLQSPAPLQLIKALNLGALGLVFTPPTAYSPLTTSTGVTANYSLPEGFDFNVQFTQVANSFTLSRGGVPIANLNSSYNPATSNMALGQLTFDLLQTPLLVPDASHAAFQEFNRDLTVGSNIDFQVVGNASVYANTSIGVVNLVNIPFNATTDLSGLQSLANPPPTITSIQVVQGTATALTMDIGVVIVNPSSISMSAGDVVLDLVYGGVKLGTVTMPNLSIVPGANEVKAVSSIDPAASPQGMELLTLYTSGAGASVSIAGSPTTTQVESLSLAFGALNIGSEMPGLASKLLESASLTILDTTLQDGLAQSVVTTNNPFVPGMSIMSIDAKITYGDISVGTVQQTFSQPPVIPGTGQGVINTLLSMNTDPHDLVKLIRAQAIVNGVDTTAFDGLLSLQQGGNPPAELFRNFNVAEFTIKAMHGLKVDIAMTVSVKLGDYAVTMPYTQTGVPAVADASILKLIPLVGTPIAQLLVERSILEFSAIQIVNPTETSFLNDIIGAIKNSGPLDALITFPNPVTIAFNGKVLGGMQMPPVQAKADVGASLDIKGAPFAITDVAAFTEFTIYALNNPDFEWTVASQGLVVSAMGVSLPGVTMTKTVKLKGFNKLSGLELKDYIINDVNDAGVHMAINGALANPANIGMTIPAANFLTEFEGKTLGPASIPALTLYPGQVSPLTLEASIVPSSEDLTGALKTIFSNALSNKPTDLMAKGMGAPGVSWLDAAIKTLQMPAKLPPWPHAPITAVTIEAMMMDFTCADCVWNPNSESTIEATVNLPFKTNAPIVELSQDVFIKDTAGSIVGALKTNFGAATVTGDKVKTTTPQANFRVADEHKDSFKQFVKELQLADTYTLGLSGTTASKLRLGRLGDVVIEGIPLDVQTSIRGMQGLKNVTIVGIPALDMSDMTEAKILTTVNIYNPSPLTLYLGDLNIDMERDPPANENPTGLFGTATMSNLVLVPGDNAVASVGKMPMSNPVAIGVTLDLGNPAVDIIVGLRGRPDSTPFESLSLAIDSMDAVTKLNGNQLGTREDYFNSFKIITTPESFKPPYPINVEVTMNTRPLLGRSFKVVGLPEEPGGWFKSGFATYLKAADDNESIRKYRTVFRMSEGPFNSVVPANSAGTTFTWPATLSIFDQRLGEFSPISDTYPDNLPFLRLFDTTFASSLTSSISTENMIIRLAAPPSSQATVDTMLFNYENARPDGDQMMITIDETTRQMVKLAIANGGQLPSNLPVAETPTPTNTTTALPPTTTSTSIDVTPPPTITPTPTAPVDPSTPVDPAPTTTTTTVDPPAPTTPATLPTEEPSLPPTSP